MTTVTNQVQAKDNQKVYIGDVEIVPTHMTEAERNRFKQEMVNQIKRQAEAKEVFLKALPKVVELAQTDCGGGVTAATLLLNLYNRHAFLFDLVGMRNLDATNWQACMDVLAYQAYASPEKEIHHYIEDGQRLMSELWDRFENSKNCIDKR